MRREFLGPLPVALGIVIVAVALLAPARAPPPPCACEVLSPQAFDALDAAGYPSVAPGSVIILDGRVTSMAPSELLSAPYRYVRLEGSGFQFNVTAYDPSTGGVGTWVRLSTVHGGERESTGPDLGHRWGYLGKTAPPGGSLVSLATLALGLAVAAWGAASWREFSRTGKKAGLLRARLETARKARDGDIAAQKAEGLNGEIDATAKMLRRGQYDSAETTLGQVEAQLARSARLAGALEEIRAAAQGEARRGFAAGELLKITDEAARERTGGNIPAAERLVTKAGELFSSLPRVRELIAAAEASASASAAQGVEDVEASALLAEARSLLSAGKLEQALPAAARAVERAREISPSAQSARAEVERLKEFLQLHPEFDRTREVRDRVRDGDELYRLGQFDRAAAEAQVGLWIADTTALEHGAFVAFARAAAVAEGYTVAPPSEQDPALGFLATRKAERLLVVTGPWRDYPSERILLAVKDFLNEGGATNAVVYSCSFSNTSTDERIEVLDASRLVDLLRGAALAKAASRGAPGAPEG